MARIGFCSGFYTSRSRNADCQTCMNFYPEADESGMGKSAMVLYSTPGLAVFATLPGMVRADRGKLFFAGRLFAVGETLSNQVLFEIFGNGTVANRGTLGPSGAMASLAPNNANQLLIASGGGLFLLNLLTNKLQVIDTTSGAALQGPVSQIAFSDSFFIALLANSQKFQVSALLNGSSWDPAQIAEIEVFPDNVVSMLVDHREIWVWGPKSSQVYYNSGAIFPYTPIPGAFIEQGCAAISSPLKLDNSVFWIGQDERGAGICWRANGYVPTRVSTHAIELAWQSYSTIADAVGYGYQDQGHSFARFDFPTASKTWIYDVATGLWHERGFWNGANFTAHLGRDHAFAFNKHIVGDWTSGNLYQMSIAFLTDNGSNIRRVRRAPHVSSEQARIRHRKLQIDVETGLGPEPPLLDGQGKPRDPQMMLCWSNDSAHTWSNIYTKGCGQSGEYKKRVFWGRLGAPRDRVYEMSVTDPIDWKIIDAYLDADPGFATSERLAKQYAKVT